MKRGISFFIPHPSALIPILFGRRSQVVRQRSAKPLFIGSIPIAASIKINNLRAAFELPVFVWSANGLPNSKSVIFLLLSFAVKLL
jgi:hypothetical protein